MSGTVTDPSGVTIPGVKVVATHDPTQRDYTTVTTDAGIYAFSTLPAGPYTLTVAQPGFKKAVQTGIEIMVAQRAELNLQLELGNVSEKVEVKADIPLLEMSTATRGQNLGPQLVSSLPIFVGGLRSAEAFVAFMPGVNSAGETSINGSVGRGKEVLIDGASITIPESGGTVYYFPGFEAFQEFKLVTSSFAAEHGRLGGGLEMMVSKSGTNQIHGAAFLNLRRDIFQAAGWATNHVLGQTPGFRAKERYNEEGGTAGGPVVIPKLYNGRNRTFFFFTYAKDIRPVMPAYNTKETLPTALMRLGDFSESGVATIYDPLTTSGSIRTPFAGNQIPTNRFSTISSNVLKYIPATTGSGAVGNYDYIGTTMLDDYVYTIKLDHAISDTNRISFFMTKRSQLSSVVQYLPGALGNGLDTYQKPDNYRANHDLVLSPTMLLHTTFGFTRERNLWNNPLQNGVASKLGFNLSGDADAMPYVTFATDNLTAWGVSQGKINNGWQFNWTTHVNQQLTWNRGKHEFKLGWDVRRLRTIDNYSTFQNGSYNFSRIQTALPTAQGTTGNAFASLLLGAVNTGSQSDTHFTQGAIRYGYHAGFWQDTWRVTPRLTLDYGIRYEVPIGWHSVNGDSSSLDPTLPNSAANSLPGALIFAGNGAGRMGAKRLYPTDYTDVGPRGGFAYRLATKSVVRGGFGIYYQTLGNGGCGSAAGGGGCTDGINGSWSQSSDGLNAAFFWGQSRNVPQPVNYKTPPRIDPTFANFGNVYYQGENFGKAPRIYNWSLTLQHEVHNWLFEAAYVGNRAHGLNSTIYMNQLSTDYLALGSTLTTPIASSTYALPFSTFGNWGKSATVAQSLRPFPQYNNVLSANAGVGQTWYDSLQTKVERRYGNVNFMASYVWSKNLTKMAYRQIFAQGANVQSQDAYNLNDAKTFSPMDQPHFFNVITSYQLPVGKGKRFLGSAGRALDTAVGGWTIAGTQQYHSGSLIQVVSATNLLASTIFSPIQKATPTGYAIRSGVSARDLDPDNKSIRWFNYGANAAPFINTPAYTLGTASIYQNEFRNPWSLQENLSITKNLTLRESVRLIYRADGFNIFNRTRFGGVNGTIGNANFGLPTGAQITARFITMGLRLEF